MTLTVLIVDDSHFFQQLLKAIINEHPELNVIGVANNGKEAIEKVKTLKPDVVTMDFEMPTMDGVTAVRIIMEENPLPILMLSSMTFDGARITLDALEAGAMDFMTKNFAEISSRSIAIKKRICGSILAIGRNATQRKPVRAAVLKSKNKALDTNHQRKIQTLSTREVLSANQMNLVNPKLITGNPKVLTIGASTGGPAALTEILKSIPTSFSLPILIIQHMPKNFTKAFSERLDKQCQIRVKEAETGDQLRPGQALMAPGGKQLVIDQHDIKRVKIIESTEAIKFKPSVDISFESLANTYGNKTLALVLTGMGRDGCHGARRLKERGAQIWTQSEDSCLIYGMPMAVDQANLSDASYDITQITERLCAL